jgi:LuxR family maltose regulon positive regulatory protein
VSLDISQIAPPRPCVRHVVRDRLLAAVDATPAGGVCVVVGGPGFGKTELLLDWASRPGVVGAWLTAARSDNDPARFWRHLAAACEHAGLFDQAESEVKDLTGFLAAMAARSRPGGWMVIDDAHVLVDEAIQADLARLVDALGDEVRLLVASRADLAWRLARQRARGMVVDIGERDLQLDRAEVGALVASSALEVPDEAVDRLAARTEGWVAGVQLALRSALGSVDPAGYLGSLRGDDRPIAEFLLEEALDDQPDANRRFLLETSILDRLSGPLCDAVTGRGDSSRRLAELERSHVLVSRLDDAEPSYRYHPLFVDLLRSELASDPEARPGVLHGRAAKWFEAHGDIDRAVRHFAAVPDLEAAVALVHDHEDELFRKGEVGLLQDWYSLLPDLAGGADPDEQLLRLLWSSLAAGDAAEVWTPALDRLHRRATRPGADPWLVAEVAVVDAHVAAREGDSDAALRRATDAIDAFSAMGADPNRPAVAYASLLAARSEVWTGAPDAAERRMQSALDDPAFTDPFWLSAFVGALAFVEVYQGHFRAGLARADRLAPRPGGSDTPPVGAIESAFARVVALRSLGLVDDARRAVDDAREVAATSTSGEPFRFLLAVEAARIELLCGDLDAAEKALANVEDLPRFAHGRQELELALRMWREERSRREGITELTSREVEVLSLLPTRLTLQEIADELFVSANTVKTHVKSIYVKLDVTNRDDATRRAAELRLIPPSR